MAKNKIQITLGFAADTSKAKVALQDLEQQLRKFTTGLGTGEITKNFNGASDAVAKMTIALREATNIDTGKFDLSKFDQSLKRSGTNLKELRDQLVKAGPEGTKTFMSLAQSIVAAEIPTKRVNAQMEKMLKTLKDTARWQLSSNIMHGLQGAVEEAYHYAQDLNRSLNDIRIVTGYSVEEMDKFAISANKAAKALSTTTNEYAKASLIYFQQGLGDAEVERRTATTIKMANVTGEAAEDVSSYMTAIWNNFDNGTKSLESYADTITALGAATASSSEEIAQGLQKFAAVANTVGLSYEYATAALATVTSQTRESADTVGTAFKTIFARLESLSLGETLDDDTTMTKYSQALASVGVSIKDSNGQLKEMDQIVDEVGQKWGSINKDQQIALAQTVAGMRQYNNFIALMDNYGVFKTNLSIAEGAQGTLESQAEIYAESWQAASKRVEAAWETIYQSILEDDFFIDLLNFLEKALTFTDKLIDSVGGLPGILSGISSILLNMFSGKAAAGLENMLYNFKSFVGLTKTETVDFKKQAAVLVEGLGNPTGEDDPNSAWAVEKQTIQDKIEAQLRLSSIQDKLSESEKAQLETQRQILDIALERTAELKRQAELAENKANTAGVNLKTGGRDENAEKNFSQLGDIRTDVTNFIESKGSDDKYVKLIEDEAKAYGVSTERMKEYIEALKEEIKTKQAFEQASENSSKALEDFGEKTDKVDKKLKKLTGTERVIKLASAVTSLTSAFAMLNNVIETWNNPDLSGGEKALSILGSLLGMASALTIGFTALSAAIWGEQAATLASSWAHLKNASIKAGAAIANKLFSTETAAVTLSTNAETGAVEANTIAWYANPVMWIALVVIGAVAAVALLVAGIVALTQALKENSAEWQLEQAKKQATEMAEALEEVKDRADELKQAFDNYKEVSNRLEDCVKGTQEWTKALQENDAKVIELMQKYPQLASMINEAGEKAIERNEDGALVIKDWAMDAVLNTANQSVLTAMTASYAANANVRQKQIEVDKEELSENLLNTSIEKGAGLGYLSDSIANNTDLFANKTKDEIIKVLETEYPISAAIYGNDIIEKWADIIYLNNDKLSELQGAIDANTLASRAETDVIKQQLLANNKIVQGSKYSEQIIKATATEDDEQLQARIEAEMEALDTERGGAGWGKEGIAQWDSANAEAKKRFAEYAAAAGIEGAVLTDTYGDDENRVFAYEDAQGVKHEVSLDDMKYAIASEKVNKSIVNEAEALAPVYNRMNKTQAGILTAALSGDTSYLSKDIIESGNIEEYVKSLNLSIAELSALGYDNLEDFTEDLSDNIDKANRTWQKTLINYSKTTRDLISDGERTKAIFASQFSDVELEKYLDNMQLVYAAGGETAAQKLNESIETLLADNVDKANQIMSIVNSIDFSQGAQSIDEFVAELNEIGVVFSPGGELYKAFSNILPSVLTQDLSTVREEIQAISDIAANIKIGSVISDEDYNTLIKYNKALKDQFMMTAEGYRFTGSSKELKDLQKDSAKNQLETTIAQNKNATALANWANNSTLNGQQVSWYGLSQGLGSSAQIEQGFLSSLLGEGGAEMRVALGYDEDYIKSITATLGDANASAEEKETARKMAQKIFGEIATVQANHASGKYDDQNAYEVYASTFTNINELNAAFESDLLGTGEAARKIYEDQFDYIIRLEKEMKRAATEFSLDIISWELDKLADTAENAAVAIEKIAEANSLASQKFELSKQDITDLVDGYEVAGATLDEKVANLLKSGIKLDENDLQVVEDYISSSQEYIDSIYANDQRLGEEILNYFVSVNKEYDKIGSKVEQITKLTNQYRNTIDLIGAGLTEVDKTFMANLSNTDYEANLAQTSAAYKVYTELSQDRDALVEKFNAAKASGDQTSMNYWEEQIEAINAEVDKAYENMQTGLENGLKSAADIFKLQMENIVETFEDSMAGVYGSLDELSEAYSQQSTLNAQYVSDYEKIYKLSKLTRQIEGSINNAASVKTKSTLADLQAEITALQESGTKLSAYDLEYLQKKYDLKQAEIALEEAQSSSRTMRLTQDSNGVWGYTYTANEDTVAGAEQNYEDKLFAMQNYNAQQLDINGQLIISIQQQFSEAIAKIYEDDTLAADEKATKIQEITDFYTKRLAYATSEYDKIVTNNAELYTKDWTNYATATGYMISDTNKFDNVLSNLFAETGDGTAAGYFQTFLNNVGVNSDGELTGGGMINGLATAYTKYKEKIDGILVAAGSSLSTFSSDINKTLYGENDQGGVVGQLQAVKGQFEGFIKDLWGLDADTLVTDSVFDKMLSAVGTWWGDETKKDSMAYKLKGAKDGIKGVTKAYTEFVTSLGGGEKSDYDGGQGDGNDSGQGDDNGGTQWTDGDTGSSEDNKEVFTSSGIHEGVKTGQQFEFLVDKNHGGDGIIYDSEGNVVSTLTGRELDDIGGHLVSTASYKKGHSRGFLKIKYSSSLDESDKLALREHGIQTDKDYYTSYKNLNKFPGNPFWFDTGGYTGDWGPEGRLAMLHQKEIVLNAQDTVNFLSAIDIVRELVKTIDLQAASASLGMSLGGIVLPSSGGQTLQQEVTIHAEFPNATDKNEIEEAFNSLMTRTSQYINTNK